jgi:hypothetical protein
MIDRFDGESSMPHSSFIAQAIPVFLIALGVTLPTAARGAEPSADADAASSARIAELNETGARAYAERNYRAAIERFVEAYAIDHDPNLLFNIARCYEKLGDLGAAIEKYEAFVAAPGADTEGRIKAKESLVELRQLKEQGGVSTAASALPAGASEGSAQSAESAPGVNVWPWLTLGAGVVVTGVGVTVYALGAHDHSLVTDTKGYGDPSVVYPMTRAEAQSYIDSGNTKKLAGGIALGVGGALVATGVVWLVTGKSESAPAQAASFTLAPNPNGVVAGYAGRF